MAHSRMEDPYRQAGPWHRERQHSLQPHSWRRFVLHILQGTVWHPLGSDLLPPTEQQGWDIWKAPFPPLLPKGPGYDSAHPKAGQMIHIL